MVLGLGYGELILVFGAGALLFGPKDLVRISRNSGRIVGWAVGYLQHAKGQIQGISGASELAKMHQEMQGTLQELQAIRNEVRQGARILSPVSSIPYPSGRAEDKMKPFAASGNPPGGTAAKEPLSEPDPPSLNPMERPFQPSAPPNHPSFSSLCQYQFPPHHLPSNFVSDMESQLGSSTHRVVSPIPVSAVSAGLAPVRDAAAAGSDIILDALLEQEVAHKAQALLESEQGKAEKGS